VFLPSSQNGQMVQYLHANPLDSGSVPSCDSALPPVGSLLVPVETWGSANKLSSVWGVDAYAERSIRKICPLLSRMNDTQLYIHDILLTSAMYRYTTRNVHLHGQLSLSLPHYILDCDIYTVLHVSSSAALVPLIAHTIHCQSCTRTGHVADEP